MRNDLLPLQSEWKVGTYLSSIRKNKRLYLITIGGRQSMKVKGEEGLRLLQNIGESIDRMKTRTNGAKNFQNLFALHLAFSISSTEVSNARENGF
jgi:hypothetical protein